MKPLLVAVCLLIYFNARAQYKDDAQYKAQYERNYAKQADNTQRNPVIEMDILFEMQIWKIIDPNNEQNIYLQTIYKGDTAISFVQLLTNIIDSGYTSVYMYGDNSSKQKNKPVAANMNCFQLVETVKYDPAAKRMNQTIQAISPCNYADTANIQLQLYWLKYIDLKSILEKYTVKIAGDDYPLTAWLEQQHFAGRTLKVIRAEATYIKK